MKSDKENLLKRTDKDELFKMNDNPDKLEDINTVHSE
jgi:hypothetical protein